MKKTRGPWTFHDCNSHFQILDENQFPIADAYGYTAVSRNFCQSNARLIAAAPDLLEAIRALLRETDGGTQPCGEEIFKQALAAVFKATGRII